MISLVPINDDDDDDDDGDDDDDDDNDDTIASLKILASTVSLPSRSTKKSLISVMPSSWGGIESNSKQCRLPNDDDDDDNDDDDDDDNDDGGGVAGDDYRNY